MKKAFKFAVLAISLGIMFIVSGCGKESLPCYQAKQVKMVQAEDGSWVPASYYDKTSK